MTPEELEELKSIHPRAVKMPLERMLEGERVQLKNSTTLKKCIQNTLKEVRFQSFSKEQIRVLLELKAEDLDAIILEIAQE